nr:DUF596 domain-containing protein [Acinetobacter sp. Marseille-Q1620]
MEFLLDDEKLKTLLYAADGQALDGLWLALGNLGKSIDFPEIVDNNFGLKKDIFFNILKKMMENKHLLLAETTNDEILYDISINDILARFKNAFPASENAAESIGAIDVGTWLVIYEADFCPFRPVWVWKKENGEDYLDWA